MSRMTGQMKNNQLEKEENEQNDKGLARLVNLVRGEKLTIDKIFPYKQITKEGYIKHKNSQYQALLKVRTYDLQSMNESDLERLITAFQRLLQVYIEPIKLTSMSYPTETNVQQNFYEEKIRQYDERLRTGRVTERQHALLQNKRLRAFEELKRMEWAEENLKDLAFFMLVFGDDMKELDNNIRKIQRLGKMHFGLDHIKDERIIVNYIRKLMNMNMEL